MLQKSSKSYLKHGFGCRQDWRQEAMRASLTSCLVDFGLVFVRSELRPLGVEKLWDAEMLSHVQALHRQ